MKYVDIYVFGDAGAFDEYNPYRIFESLDTQRVLLSIAKMKILTANRMTLSSDTELSLEKVDTIIKELLNAQLLIEENECFKLAFPFFVESDIKHIERFSERASKNIGNTLIKQSDEFKTIISKYGIATEYSLERILYHIIGDKVFDGSALDYFGDKGLFAISKKQPMGRDYLVIGYEKSSAIEDFSNNLLCSSNNYRSKDITFNSFGDSMGNRKDFYRYFRRIQSNVQHSTEHVRLNEIYNTFVDEMNKSLMDEFGGLVQNYIHNSDYVYSDKELAGLKFIEEMGYIEIKGSKICHRVPIFIEKLIDEISRLTLNVIQDEVTLLFEGIQANISELTSVIHGVSCAEIGNELWHQVFGNINEYLSEKGFFSNPKMKAGEGRYLKALYYSGGK
ncbi:PE-PPE domain-containing protein [Vallitalea okinawensis]|uniref:PE-PPE domain-containing protein n=1 Tax=Vallitalea okinawensis TaxID=2078660 RepID=UPI000CFB259D|nr:hypothetical protein [Vallitalea okinawensis]